MKTDKKRNKELNELLVSKRNSKHKDKFGEKASRARKNHLNNKRGIINE